MTAPPTPAGMPEDLIAQLAQAAGIETDLWIMGSGSLVYSKHCEGIPRAEFTDFARACYEAGRAREREACAVECEYLHRQAASYFAAMGSAGMPEYDARDCAAAIRSRGAK